MTDLSTLRSGDRVRLARAARRISQADLARQVSARQPDISAIERGWIPPAKLRAALGAALGEPDLFDPEPGTAPDLPPSPAEGREVSR